MTAPPLRPYQHLCVADAVAFVRDVSEHDEWTGVQRRRLYAAPTGCHAYGEKVLRHDGTPIEVQAVRVGDHLAGDGGPRRVLALHRGVQTMARVVPIKGEPFVVNLGHILTLVHTVTGDLVDVPVYEWLVWAKTKQHLYKLIRRRGSWGSPEVLPIHPWVLGVLLGDGALTCGAVVTNSDPDVHAELQRLAGAEGVNNGRVGKGRNPLWECLKDLGLAGADAGSKFVPTLYKRAACGPRLELIAGMLDTDGHYTRGGYDWISKSRQLAEDFVFLCRSVGLAAYMKACRKGCQTGAVGDYFRVSVNGDCDKIPCRVKRKKAAPRRQIKDALRTGFRVELLPEAPYYGFEVDGDHRYLMADFTLTHNSGKTRIQIEILRQLRAGGLDAWAVTPSLEILRGFLAQSGVAVPAGAGDEALAALGETIYVTTPTRMRNRCLDGRREVPDVWLLDECFPAGTLVGGVPIEKIRVGDRVPSFDERNVTVSTMRKVVRLYKSKPKSLVTVRHMFGELTATANHPVMTLRGWVSAGALTSEDMVLQDRRGVAAAEGGDRGGRQQPQHARGEGAGPAEGRVAFWSRVDGVEVHEPGRDGTFGGLCPDGLVYNLEVEGTHTYVADGVGVHNCHHGIEDNEVSGCNFALGPASAWLGFTATPYRGGPSGTAKLREAWGDPTLLLTYPEAVAEGFVALPRVEVVPLVDDDHVKIVGGEFQEKAAAGAYANQIGALATLCASYLRKVPFSERVEGAEVGFDVPTCVSVPSTATVGALVEALDALGVESFPVTQATKAADRERFYDMTRRGLGVLVQIKVVSEGVDMPWLGRMIDARPLVSPVAWLQQFGRITRPGFGAKFYVCTNRNLERHAYLLQGALPRSAVAQAQAAFAGPSKRTVSRAVGLESLGKLKAIELPLADGVKTECYMVYSSSPTAPDARVTTEYAILLDPCHDEPIVATRVNAAKDGEEVTWGRWQRTTLPGDFAGFASSARRGSLTDKQRAFWARCARRYGLDPEAAKLEKFSMRQFQALPVLRDLGLSLHAAPVAEGE